MKKLLSVIVFLGCIQSQAFALLAEVRSGPVNTQYGAVNPARGDRTGAIVTAEGHAKYQEAVLSGNVFYGANPQGTAVTTVAGLSGVNPVLTLYNPTGSGKNLVLLEVGYEFTAAPAAAVSVSLAYNLNNSTAPAVTTNANIVNALLTGQTAAPTGQVYRAAQLVATPIAFRFLSGTTGAAAISGAAFTDNTDGKVIVTPGTAISIQTTSAASMIAHFLWEEVPL